MGKPPRVAAAMSSAVMARLVLCCSPMAYPRTLRECASRTAQVDPALRAPQVGEIRDAHPIQGTLIPLAGAVIFMGHWTSSAAPIRVRVRVQACEALAAHRRGDRTHPHIHARARQGMADARSPIGATRDLVFPGHRLIQTPPRQRALAPVGRPVFPRVIACARHPQDLGHQGD